jgi:hypothetical protein
MSEYINCIGSFNPANAKDQPSFPLEATWRKANHLDKRVVGEVRSGIEHVFTSLPLHFQPASTPATYRAVKIAKAQKSPMPTPKSKL